VGCRGLNIFKILGNLWEYLGNSLGILWNFLGIFWDFLRCLLGIFWAFWGDLKKKSLGTLLEFFDHYLNLKIFL
jgi:hypothetical protein